VKPPQPDLAPCPISTVHEPDTVIGITLHDKGKNKLSLCYKGKKKYYRTAVYKDGDFGFEEVG